MKTDRLKQRLITAAIFWSIAISVVFFGNGCSKKVKEEIKEEAKTDQKKEKAVENQAKKEVETFNYVLGTQTVTPAYKFSDESDLVETAKAIRDMGSNTLKIALGTHKYMDCPGSYASLADLIENEPSFRAVLEMDFSFYQFWAYGADSLPAIFYDGLSDEEKQQEYKAIYDLAAYLLTQYRDSGKTFYIGHWEGDWHLYWQFDTSQLPPESAITGMIDWLNIRQKAIDDAKTAVGVQGMAIYHYAEVCKVDLGLEGGVCMTTHVLPHTDVDYVSYSTYDITREIMTYEDMKLKLTAALDFIEEHLPQKSGIPGKRVWIGEYGYPVGRGGAHDPKTPQEQDRRSRIMMRVALEWGCPFVLWWEMYNNEVRDGKHNGFWLIDDKGEKQPIYHTHQKFYDTAKEYVAGFLADNGRVPTAEEFKEIAVTWLE